MKINRLGIGMDLDTEEPKYRLIRERDKLAKESSKVTWIEWNEDGTFKKNHPLPALGLSLLMYPFNVYHTWLTTTVTEIVEQNDDYIKFKTSNSNYELFKL
jgi:hypothetical protein